MTGLLVGDALRQNASWCALVCRQHGVATTADDGLLVTAGPPPPYFPHAMTLVPGTTSEQVLAAVGDREHCGVKDSFARLDLGPAGFTVLFEASWLALVGEPSGAARHAARRVPHAVVGDDVVALALDGGAGSCTAHRHDGVIGLQDVSCGHDAARLGALVSGARDHLGDLPVVGYEHGADLDAAVRAGFDVLGPLRVWTR